MKIGVLTSSRADYGVYTPLLEKISQDNHYDLEIIVFGMHTLENQGNTFQEIENDAFGLIHMIYGMPLGDSKFDISYGYGELVKNFAEFWNKHYFDCVLALGDRWEMSAAVQAALPFEIVFAHLFGGETTLGALDNIYRHQITQASKYHFTSADEYSLRVQEITGEVKNVYTVGSVSLENIRNMILPKWISVRELFEINFDDFILITVHPESVKADRNYSFVKVINDVIERLVVSNNILITKSNSDVMGSYFNEIYQSLEKKYPDKVKLVTSLGRINYFKAMEQCTFLLGNTSSGIVEAASFGKWVINIGDRQKGRLQSCNAINVSFNVEEIVEKVEEVKNFETFNGENIYVKANTSNEIIKVLSLI